MRIYTNLTELPLNLSNTAIALGTFDGLHIGHRQLIRRVIASARKSGGLSVVFTFSNHPRSVLFPEHSPKLLMTQERKSQILAEMGLDILVTIPFTEPFFKMSPDQFVELLVARFHPELVVIGHNYCYGYKGQGTSETIKRAGQNLGFAVEVFDMVMNQGDTVSSTLIRHLLAAGEIGEATRLLAHPYELQGVVVNGDKRGRLLGFPTANVAVDHQMLLPKDGVYAVTMKVGSQSYEGVANVGSNPTFQGAERRLEVFLLNFSGDLYGKEVTVRILTHLRQEITFKDVTSLVTQMEQDIRDAQCFFSKC